MGSCQVVVSKPGSIPMHPCGAYKYNSLVGGTTSKDTLAMVSL